VLEQPSALELSEELRSQLCLQDLFSGCPAEDDALLFAVPVCAPYATLATYAYKAKLTPGAQKKGKAGKQALGMFCSGARSERHRELLQAVVDDDVIRVMLPNVKVAAPGLAQAKASAKAEKKAAATQKKKATGEED
jgi:hypothetical protein